jgi:hypothetical protein
MSTFGGQPLHPRPSGRGITGIDKSQISNCTCLPAGRDFTLKMNEDKEENLEEAKELFKDGLKKIFKATKKISKEIVQGFKEGYAKDVTKKEDPDK